MRHKLPISTGERQISEASKVVFISNLQPRLEAPSSMKAQRLEWMDGGLDDRWGGKKAAR